jgi:hypothetical protein
MIYLIGGIVMAVIGWGFILYNEWGHGGSYPPRNEYSEWAMWSATWPISLPFLIAVALYLWRSDRRA